MDLILTAHKMRIYPNSEQIQIIETTFGAARRMFNSLHAQFPSSKMCSNCKVIHELTNDLSVREWQCPTCNSIHDRDINAAINILNEGLTLI